MNENNEHIRIWPAGLTGNMDGIPKIRPERVLRQRYIGTTNNADDKMNKTMTKNPLITQEQVEDIINTKYPDHADYWLHGANKKHTEIVINARCDKCGHQERFTIKHRSDLKRLLKRNCAGCEMKEAKRNKHLNIPLPFGKYRGKTINAVMLEKPSYLAWMVDEIEGRRRAYREDQEPQSLSRGMGSLRGEESEVGAQGDSGGARMAAGKVFKADGRRCVRYAVSGSGI